MKIVSDSPRSEFSSFGPTFETLPATWVAIKAWASLEPLFQWLCATEWLRLGSPKNSYFEA
jgi:hypothetical protein